MAPPNGQDVNDNLAKLQSLTESEGPKERIAPPLHPPLRAFTLTGKSFPI